jgi:hypothetical protein
LNNGERKVTTPAKSGVTTAIVPATIVVIAATKVRRVFGDF